MPAALFWLVIASIGINTPRSVTMGSIMENRRCSLLLMLRHIHLDVLEAAIKVVLVHTRNSEVGDRVQGWGRIRIWTRTEICEPEDHSSNQSVETPDHGRQLFLYLHIFAI